jgi:iron(III) transport system substrate-binding protein
MRENRRLVLKSAAALVASVALGQHRVLAQATPEATTADALVIYSGQHEDWTNALATAFTAATGIPVEVRAGDDANLANQIIEEGDATSADIFLTEEPGPAAMLDARGLLSPIDATSLAKVNPDFNPSSGNWLGYGARARVIFYNPDLIAEEDLPASYFDLVEPEWKGKFAYAPSGAFVAVTTYMINTYGEEETLAWLRGIKENGENLGSNGAIRDAVEAGQIPFGISNHYYWYILAEERGGPDNVTSRVHVMGNEDPGAIVLSSAVAIPAASANEEEAQQFVSWLADAEGGQAILAETTPQYPFAPGVESRYGLVPLSELDPPLFDQGMLADSSIAAQLLIDAGIV